MNEDMDYNPVIKTVVYDPSIEEELVSMYSNGVTIINPSGNGLNNHFSEVVMSKIKNVILINGVICKMTTEEVDDIVLDFDSKFREFYKDKFNAAYFQLGAYLEEMDEKRHSYFIRNFIKDPDMRNALDVTLKESKDRFAQFANKINGQHVLLIDDGVSGLQPISHACKIIKGSYTPKSITVLKLSPKEN